MLRVALYFVIAEVIGVIGFTWKLFFYHTRLDLTWPLPFQQWVNLFGFVVWIVAFPILTARAAARKIGL